ncbi:helicase-associated domain-containing protein [Effusibacillus consociatus]|uniref:Helicase-associated domain-containing protein n=1 Tax=Effusibacillus consociatus TaxID=1117041 RepID=A0ABV9Q4F6_9BACL
MRLSECLNSSDIDALRKIAERYDFDCHRSSKNSLMQTIMAHFNNRKFIQDRLLSLESKEYRDALMQIVMDKRQCFSREDLSAIAKRAIGNQSGQETQLITNLLRDGWVYRLGSHGGKTAYFVPEDVMKTMKEFLAVQLQSQVETISGPPLVYRDDQFAIVRDAVQFISFVKNHDVKITQNGVIFKRQLLQLLDSFEIKEEPVTGGWRFGYGRRFFDYPDRFALFYDCLYSRGIIEEQEAGILAVTDKTEEWLEKPDKNKLLDLVNFWRLLYRRPIPRLSFALNTMARAVCKKWTLVESVNQLLSPYVGDYYYDNQVQVMEKRIYQMMVNLGLLCYGKLVDGRAVMRLSDLGRELLLEETADEAKETLLPETTPLIIQPNFDLLLPAAEAGRLDWELSQFTDLIRADMMRVYRITKSSISRGLQKGWSYQRIIGFLDQHSGSLLPVNVKRMIERWCQNASGILLNR